MNQDVERYDTYRINLKKALPKDGYASKVL